ncbi:MAG: hypothetical protein U1F58_14320 [Burkholderiales bacterium]
MTVRTSVALLCACAALLVAAAARSQGPTRPACDGVCGVIQSMTPVDERQQWSPLGSVQSLGNGGLVPMAGQATMIQVGPGFSNQGLVVVGAAGGAVYAQKPGEYRRQWWDVTLRMDDGTTRVVSMKYEPLLLQEGDYVRVSGNNLELVNP